MGGAMGLNADATGIQFRMLNRTEGPIGPGATERNATRRLINFA